MVPQVTGIYSNFGQILFCDTIPDWSELRKRNPSCQKFFPVSTSQGVCQSYNSLHPIDIYENLPYLNTWSSVFDSNNMSRPLAYPKGYGSTKGFNIILNSFESFKSQRTSNQFVIAITNENNHYDIIRHSFNLLPGHEYTFRIMASQTGDQCFNNFLVIFSKSVKVVNFLTCFLMN